MFWKKLNKITGKIGFKLTLWYSGILFFSIMVFCLCTYAFLASTLKAADYQEIRIQINEIQAAYESAGEQGIERFADLHKGGKLKHSLFIRVSDKENVTHYQLARFKKGSFPIASLNMEKPENNTWKSLANDTTKHDLDILTIEIHNGLFLQLGVGSETRDRILFRLRHIFLLGILPVLFMGVVAGFLLSMRALHPLRNIINTVNAIDRGQMSSRVKEKGTGDELDELARLFNGMLNRISRLIQGMEDSLDNVAHDLRTPLTRLRMISEEALTKWPDPDASRKAHEDEIEESERIIRMLNALMDIAEADAGVAKLNMEILSLAEVAAPIYEMYAFVAEEKNIRLQNKVSPDIFIFADSDKISQALANLMDNAVKFTPCNGSIVISSQVLEKEIEIIVMNSGTTISQEDSTKIWNRLYRGGDHSKSPKGLGLGLSLVKAIVASHKGRVHVSSSPKTDPPQNQTTSFSIFLPVYSKGK